ncbi:arginase family protein [Aquamicrobium terrae]|uniref:Agmatinase n=1 Tax=Aquamicrobium terrae TaxID=1324945 RepID=A0ABV2N0D3_9HYPH
MHDKKPLVMPMLGSADASTFMGVKPIGLKEKIECDVVVLGIPCATPYRSATEYLEANLNAPQSIREGIAMWAGSGDRIDFDRGVPLFSKDRVRDMGDLPVKPDRPEANRALIKQTVMDIVKAGAVPIAIGGDDSIPVPLIAGLEEIGPLTILQIDAHIDWRDEVDGERNGLSNVMRRVSELPFVNRMVQVGQRGLGSAGPDELADAKKWGVEFFGAEDVFDRGVDHILERIPAGANVHINLDLDGLDPSIMPAVFVPAPGGLLYWHLIKLIRGVARKAKLVSFAMVEFVPARDSDSNAALLAGRVLTMAISAALESKDK